MNWFEVDKEGLKQLQAGRAKTFIINELVQNAFDEETPICDVLINQKGNDITVQVTDESPEGFKDITHAYKLFSHTYKRENPTKRGRYNLGEKQVISCCSYAKVVTTKGTIIFDSDGRKHLPDSREKGSVIMVRFEGTEDECKMLIKHAQSILPPQTIKYVVNGQVVSSPILHKQFNAKLDTELLDNEVMKIRPRTTSIDLIQSYGQSYIFEMGIPVMPTDCPWHINVQQKIPLNIDRDSIKPAYIQDIYAEVLNATYLDLDKEQVSENWVRSATKDPRAQSIAIQEVMKKRYGEKFCIANPNDKRSIDEALSSGYNVIFGGELSKDEWQRIKECTPIQSSSQMFGNANLTLANPTKPTKNMLIVAKYAKRIAKAVLHIDITVGFVNEPTTRVAATYGNRYLTFNVGTLGTSFFDNPISPQTTDIIIHELGHEEGTHTEKSYHDLLTKIGGALPFIALSNPEFFSNKDDA